MKLDPQKIDFFSLNVLCTVFRKRSFSGAGESLNLSQSVISYTIDRLRKTFHDQLFIRRGGGIIPTDRCTELVSQSENILSQYVTEAVAFRHKVLERRLSDQYLG
jgi:DNA-binding transcriptional LysR family regulator